MRTLLLNMMLLGFLPLNAQKLYVCQDNFSYELTMTDNDTVFYQVDEEDQRIAFGLNLVFNIEQVDSVVFDKPTHLKNGVDRNTIEIGATLCGASAKGHGYDIIAVQCD